MQLTLTSIEVDVRQGEGRPQAGTTDMKLKAPCSPAPSNETVQIGGREWVRVSGKCIDP